MERLGAVLGGLGILLKRFDSVLEASWAVLGASWRRLGDILGAFWGVLGVSWTVLWAVWRRHGRMLCLSSYPKALKSSHAILDVILQRIFV